MFDGYRTLLRERDTSVLVEGNVAALCTRQFPQRVEIREVGISHGLQFLAETFGGERNISARDNRVAYVGGYSRARIE